MNPLYFVIKFRNYLLKGKRKKFPYKSIGIGGISMGGSGKTPLAIEVIKFFKKKNVKLALLTRGYRRKDKSLKIVLENEKVTPYEIGDEPFLIYKKENIPIGVCKDRLKSAREILKNKDVSLFILDDAMQIKKYYFDLNVFVLSEREIFERERFFPEGISRDLREEIFFGDVIIINTKMNNKRRYRIFFLERKKIPYFFANYRVKGFKNIKGEIVLPEKRDYFLLVTGIANPSSLKRFIERRFILREHIKFLDHHFYTEKDIKRILELKDKLKCDYILTTEKDIVRMNIEHDFFIYPEIEMEIEKGFYRILSEFVKQVESEEKG